VEGFVCKGIFPTLFEPGMKVKYLLFFIILLTSFSCKKDKVEACVFATPDNPYVGQPVTVVNCSENFKQSFIDFDDGTPQVLVNNTIVKQYYFTRTYSISVESFSSDNNSTESATSNFSLEVRSPNQEDLLGEWTLYRFLGHDESFPTTNEAIFASKIIERTDLNYRTQLLRDSVAIIENLNGSFKDTTTWYFSEPGKIQLDTHSTQVVTFYNDTMIILAPYRFGFSLNYYSRNR